MADVPRSVVETLARSLVRKITIAGSCTTLALRFAHLERRSTSQCALEISTEFLLEARPESDLDPEAWLEISQRW